MVKPLKNGEEKNPWKTEEKKKWTEEAVKGLIWQFYRRIHRRYKINYYFNLFRRWSVKNPLVNFKFRTKIFNDPSFFSWSVGNSVGTMTRSDMHLIHNPLEFTRSVGNCVGKIDPPTNYRWTYIHRYICRWLWHFK